ncbi:MAG: hypothetical protein ACOX56_00045 [Acholeplasmataceae bacterium]|jgi:hypothetical protein
MKLKQFMIIDMLIFLALSIISEWIGSLINPKLLYISFAQVLLLALLIRWQWWGLIPVAIVAAIRPLIYKFQGFNEYLIYSIPILILALALIPIKLKWLNDMQKKRFKALLYFTTFYLLFVIVNGLLITILVNNQYSLINDLPKYLLSLIVGNIIMFFLAGQKTMLINISENHQTAEKDRDEHGND